MRFLSTYRHLKHGIVSRFKVGDLSVNFDISDMGYTVAQVLEFWKKTAAECGECVETEVEDCTDESDEYGRFRVICTKLATAEEVAVFEGNEAKSAERSRQFKEAEFERLKAELGK